MKNILKTVLVVPALLAAGGCATTAPAENERMVKIYRTGSNLPVMVPYMGAEHLRYVEAQRDRQAVDRLVAPPMPLNSN